MSLRIKLPLFTALFVFFAAVAILWVSLQQTYKRGERNIEDIRTFEKARIRSVIKEQANFAYSLISAQNQQASAKNRVSELLDNIKNVTYDNGRGYFWIADTCSPPRFIVHPYLANLSRNDSLKVLSLVKSAGAAVRDNGEGYSVKQMWPRLDKKGFSDSLFSETCYARLYRPLGWIIASARYTDDIDAIINKRISQTRSEITAIILERIVFAAVVLMLSVLAIVIFTGMITRPINRFAKLTEEITSERKGYSERIAISSRDEIGRLANSFNHMLGHIEETLAKLEENGRKYRELVENANSAILHIDKDGNILFFNEFTQKLFDLSPNDLVGKNIAGIIAVPQTEVDPAARSIFYEVLKSPASNLHNEEQVRTKTGETKWIAWANKPLYDRNGELREILCIGSDITARKNAEEVARMQQRKLIQTDKMATLGILVSGIAHEINNPNNFIILNAENLSDMWNDIWPVLDEHYKKNPDYRLAGLSYEEMRRELPELLQSITGGAQRIKRIVQSLKDFSKQESGDINQRVVLKDVVEAATVILGSLIKKATEHFEVVTKERIPEVNGNFQRLEQVMINLIKNACEANDGAAKPITVIIEYKSEIHKVVVSIRDQGLGIKPENMKYVMDPFFTTKRDQGGTGLGLAISFNIVKDHGGELILESTVGKGTSATVLLPVA